MNELTPKTYEEFLELTDKGTVVPVVRRVMADLLTPVAAYLKIERLSPFSFLLESVEGGEKVARYSFLGFDPHIVVRSRAGKVTITDASREEESEEPMLAYFGAFRAVSSRCALQTCRRLRAARSDTSATTRCAGSRRYRTQIPMICKWTRR